jgi:protein TonB
MLIIGVTFNPAMLEDFSDAISLEVTIVADPDQDIDRPDRAEYLAQASQEGGGNTAEQVRPSAPAENASPIDNPGDETGDNFVESTEHQVSADQLLATAADQDRIVTDDPRVEPQPDDRSALALESGADPRQLVISADTRESIVAAYLDNWKRRIESVGDQYFPTLGNLEGLSGSPTLEVSIDASGQLAEVIIRKSSGSRILDQAALDILRRASPFDPFPAAISTEYDSLRFAYKWLFSEEIVPATAAVARQ